MSEDAGTSSSIVEELFQCQGPEWLSSWTVTGSYCNCKTRHEPQEGRDRVYCGHTAIFPFAPSANIYVTPAACQLLFEMPERQRPWRPGPGENRALRQNLLYVLDSLLS